MPRTSPSSSPASPDRSRAPLVRAILTVLILAGAFYFAVSTPAKLGLDLRGGTQIVLETKDSPKQEANAESTKRAVEVLGRRVDALGIAESKLTQSGDRRIIVELPGVQDPRKALDVIGRTAQLSFHPVQGIAKPKEKPDKGERIIRDKQGQRLILGQAALTGEGVADARGFFDNQQTFTWMVEVEFDGQGKGAWKSLTAQAACAPPGDPKRRVAIVLDNRVISSPQVDPSVQCNVGIPGGSTQITGNFTEASAKDLAVLIKGGALPVPVEVIEQRTVGPTLGAEAIEASAQAAIIGLALTAIFIIAVYRLVGVLATIALGCYALISYAALVLLGATLTLPGLAGFVLAIGMAIDANVLVFERAREEYAALTRRGLQSALDRGFKGAWSAIIDSNVTTILAAGLLFFFASGPVRGYGVTVTLGVIASMVSALIISRVLAEWAVRRSFVTKRRGLSGLAHLGKIRSWLNEHNPDVMGRSRRWLVISGALLVIALTGIVGRGVEFGVEFTGGRLMEYSTSKQIRVEQARDAVAEAGFPRAVVQTSGQENISIRTGQISNDEEAEIRSELSEVAGKVSKERDALIGPTLGEELRQKAIIAVVLALAAQMLYLAIRFRWTFGLATVLAMFQDLLIVIGAFAWMGKPLDGVFLAAALTIIGWSVNDSVVVFDRVRELWVANPTTPFARNANSAVLQTVPRTINTGLGAVFILGALVVLGGDSLTDFALALLIGLVVGTFSSTFTSTPLAIELQRLSKVDTPPRVKAKPTEAVKRRRRREADDSGAVV